MHQPAASSNTVAPVPLLPPAAITPLLQPVTSAARLDLQLVYWGLTDWEAARQRPQHLAQHLSQYYNVLYVRPIPYSQLLRARHPLPPAIEHLTNHLCLYRPRALSPGRIALIHRINYARARQAIRGQLDPACRTILWLSHPEQAAEIGQYNEALVCYDLMDFHAAFKSGKAREAIAHAERSMLRRADLVFASSQALQRHAQAVGARSVLVPNAAEFEPFARAATDHLPVPAALIAAPRPRLLFYGTLGPWVETRLIADIARRQPHWSLVLVGPLAGADLAPLAALPNVLLIGSQPYAALPAFLQHADVCLLPFKGGELTQAVDPVKVYEYLAAGKPVVATPLLELEKCGRLIDTIRSAGEAAYAIERHLSQPENDSQRLARLAFAAEHTWAARAARIRASIEAALSQPTRSS